MSRWRTALAILALVGGLALTACGEDGDDATGPGGGGGQTSSPSEASDAPPPEDSEATQVVYTRSGGIAGDRTTYTFAAGQPPPQGFTAQEQRTVLDLASAPALQELPVQKVPMDLCCDMFVYEVTVTWADGTTRTYRTADTLKTPEPLDSLIQAAG